MAYTVDYHFESKGSVEPDRLMFSSGVYYFLSSGDAYYNRCETVADEVASSPLWTTDKEVALAWWDEHTRNHYTRNL